MKKSIRILAVVMTVLMLCLTLASCGKKLSGTYKAELGGDLLGYEATYEFSGSKVEVTKEGTVLGVKNSVTIEGTYEIKDDKITFTFETEDKDIKSGTFAFEETEDGIKIGVVEYKKA